MPNDLSTLTYRNSILTILTKLIKIIPLRMQADIDHAYEILDQSTPQQLNRYWALIQKKDFDTLRKEFSNE